MGAARRTDPRDAAYWRVYRLERQGHITAWRRAKRSQNPERYRSLDRAGRARRRLQNPERYAAQHRAEKQRRRARLAGVPHTLTAEQWVAVKAAYRQRCGYCNRRRSLYQDHVIPLAHGGEHVVSNIVPACWTCNAKKGSRILVGRVPLRLLL